jgi:hypothetical protein
MIAGNAEVRDRVRSRGGGDRTATPKGVSQTYADIGGTLAGY